VTSFLKLSSVISSTAQHCPTSCHCYIQLASIADLAISQRTRATRYQSHSTHVPSDVMCAARHFLGLYLPCNTTYFSRKCRQTLHATRLASQRWLTSPSTLPHASLIEPTTYGHHPPVERGGTTSVIQSQVL
ncbi:hypothetical protein CLAIMM_12298 isoform 2, partial [Cladophialophora immunda]